MSLTFQQGCCELSTEVIIELLLRCDFDLCQQDPFHLGMHSKASVVLKVRDYVIICINIEFILTESVLLNIVACVLMLIIGRQVGIQHVKNRLRQSQRFFLEDLD